MTVNDSTGAASFNLSPSRDLDIDNNSDVNINRHNYIAKKYYTAEMYNHEMKNKTGYSLFSLNINSLRKNVDNFVTFLNTIKNSPDIIVLSEIRHNVEEIFNTYFNNYAYYIKYPEINKCGGVAILIKKCIDHKIEDNLNIEHDLIENIVVKIKNKNNNIYVSGLYKHPKMSILELQNALKSQINKILQKDTFILAGDFNIDLCKKETCIQIKNYYDKLKTLNFTQLINVPTRITKISKTLIDHIYYRTNKNKLVKSGVFLNSVSDHLITFMTTNEKIYLNFKSRPMIRIFSERYIERFKTSLSNCEEKINLNNPNLTSDHKWNSFLDYVTTEYQDTFPLKQISRKKYKTKPWITPGILRSAKTKEKLYLKFIKNPSPSNTSTYTRYKNAYNIAIRKARENYYKNALENDNKNVNLWKITNEMLNNKTEITGPDVIQNNDGTLLYDDKSKAELFNTYFSTIGEKMNSKIVDCNTDFASFMPNKLNKSIKLNEITESEIKAIIKRLTTKTSAGIDQISQKLIKIVESEISPILLKLINFSIKDRIYPKCLKIAKIIPIYKSGNKSNCNNYRPISLLSTFNKIFELKLKDELSSFIEKNNILYIDQYGFRKYHNTIDALINCYDHIINETRSKNKIIGIFIDFQKAFDTIDNNILIKKLEYYGITGPFNALLKSYITNRSCITKIGQELSIQKIIEYGVPQGSVLGPLLFSLYINDIKNLSPNIDINLFADDTSIFCSAKSYHTLIEKCNDITNHLEKWVNCNKLTVNIEKTHFVDFSKDKNKYNIEKVLTYNNKRLIEKDNTKYLGVILQNDLKWDKHILSLINKLNSRIPLYLQLRNILPTHKKIVIFNALSGSLIRYGVELYAKNENKWTKQLQKTQNRLLKLLLGLKKRTSTNLIHKNNEILKVNDLAKLRSLLICHRFVHHNNEINNAYRSLSLTNTRRNIRRILNFTISPYYYQKTNKIVENSVVHWNELNNELKSIKNRYTFKQKISEICLNDYNN